MLVDRDLASIGNQPLRQCTGNSKKKLEKRSNGATSARPPIARRGQYGQETSSSTWSFDSPYAISYRCSTVTDSLVSSRFRDNKPQTYRDHDLDLSSWCHRKHDHLILQVLFRSVVCHFLLVVRWDQASISNRFQDIRSPRHVNEHNNEHTRAPTNEPTNKHDRSQYLLSI